MQKKQYENPMPTRRARKKLAKKAKREAKRIRLLAAKEKAKQRKK